MLTALFLGPLISALVWMSPISSDSGSFDTAQVLVMAFAVYVFSMQGLLIIGIPALLIAHRLKVAHWWVALAVGLAAGSMFGVLLNQSGVYLLRYALAGGAPAVFTWWCWNRAYQHADTRVEA
ncbi:hypothetical protein [Halomonas sp. A29]|uniref:hypothetical protein n=1 Tax=Halomonas sp. A29 TaxID=3102786 RepID=UPI00398AD7E4